MSGVADDSFRVLDLTSTLAGAYCSRLLSSAGVSVTRAEPPDGHPLRRWGATGARIEPGGSGPLFAWLSGGLASVSIDGTDEADLDALTALAATMHAILWSPGAVISNERLRACAPNTTITSITNFGLTGPWANRPATEFTLQALSGGPALRGSRAWPPMSAGGQHGEYMIGVFSAVATLIGLRQTAIGGGVGGGVIDVSGLEAVMMTQLFNPHTMETQVGGVRPKRAKATVADVVASKDGYVGFAVVNRVQHWHDFCTMIEQPAWAEDRTLDSVVARTERHDELNPAIHAWASARTTAEIVELATLLRIPCIEVGNGETLPMMDHFAIGGFYDRNPGGDFLQPAPPFRMHPPIPGIGELKPAPAIGARIRSIQRPTPLDSFPLSPVATRPFEGLRVADFTSFWAGPFVAHTLAMFGADVIHVESTVRPDGARLMNQHPVTEPQWWERSSYFHATNTNKRGITLDMNRARGRALAVRLVAECDVVVENYSPRVMESWGLSWDDVRAVRPDAIMVRMPAFGLSGPWRDRTGFAMTMEQVSGMAWLTGFPEHSPGALFGPCDPSAGLHALVGLLAALDHRRRTGEGRLVEAPMVASALNVAAEQVIEHSSNGVRLDRMGNRGIAAAPQNCYLAAESDVDGPRWVAIAVANDAHWSGLRAALGHPPWAAASDLDTVAGRRANHDFLDRAIAAWCASKPSAAIVDVLWSHGVPTAPVVHPSENLTMAQLVHRRFFEPVDHPVHGDSIHSTFPFRLPNDSGPVHRSAAPLLGEHNDAVLGDLLGLTPAELTTLRDDGIIGSAVVL